VTREQLAQIIESMPQNLTVDDFIVEYGMRVAAAQRQQSSLTTDEILDCAKDFEGQLPEGWMKIVYAVQDKLLRQTGEKT
jgi:hypothetical protein